MKNIFFFFVSVSLVAGGGYLADSLNGNLIYRNKQAISTASQFLDTDTSPVKEIITPTRLSLIFAGDMMFDRAIRSAGERHGYMFILEDMRSLLTSVDFVVANLEGPITSYESVSKGTNEGEEGNMRFTFDSKVAPLLKEFNIGAVSLGNNHILNFGKEGLLQTRARLEESGILFFGDSEENQIVYIDRGGIPIAFVAYNQFLNPDAPKTIERIQEARRNADIVVVYSHWGEEYETRAGKNITILAHTFIDAGADIVIGAHPHVVQQREEYGKGVIYYSLGNFVFDQYFSDNARCGMMVKVDLIKKEDGDIEKQFSHIPIFLSKNGKTVPYGCVIEGIEGY